MSSGLYQRTTAQRHGVVHTLVAANLSFTLVAVFAWPQLLPWLEPALYWAAGYQAGPSSSNMMHAPLLFVWVGPAICGFLGWLLVKFGKPELAGPVAAFPVVYAVCVAVVMYLELGA